MRRFRFTAISLLALSLIGACAYQPYMRDETAKRLASAAWMMERYIPAGNFQLRAYERMHKRYAPADVYIEGDGFDDNSKGGLKIDPTPMNPVALHLATRDKADNVVYLARPCQFMGNEGCDESLWQGRRYSPEVLASMDTALNEIKRRYDIEGFNLIGFGGGGAVAALLAAQRDDVLTLRTVAGNLDHRAFTALHEMPPLDGSLNPPEFSSRLATMPQYHFIGGQDEDVPPSILASYMQALGMSNCVNHDLVQEAAHTEGWVDKWPELLARPVRCAGPVSMPAMDYMPMPEPIYTAPEVPEKP